MSLTKFQHNYLQECNHRWNFKIGATGSGKSWLDYSVTIPKRAFALQGKGLAVLLGNTQGTLERNILDPMRNIWGDELVGFIRSDNTVDLFGHRFYALGADNKKRVEKIQGATIEYCYGDEVTTWNQEVFEMLKSRLRTDHSFFDGTANPANPQHWLKAFIDSDADIYCQQYTIDDGCLPPEVIEELKKEYAGTFRYNRYILGQWAIAEGLVYDMFNPDIAIRHEETEGAIYVSCDYGIQNATTFLVWQKTKPDKDGKTHWHCKKEYYYSGRDQQKQKTVTELVDGLESLLQRYTDDEEIPEKIIVDPSASALIVELRRRGYSVQKANNDVLDGIADVSTLLYSNLLTFEPSCKHTINEFAVYAWDQKAGEGGSDKPIKENDHCMDAVRYFVKTMRIVKRAKETEQQYTNYFM